MLLGRFYYLTEPSSLFSPVSGLYAKISYLAAACHLIMNGQISWYGIDHLISLFAIKRISYFPKMGNYSFNIWRSFDSDTSA